VMLTFGARRETFHARIDLPRRFDLSAATAPLLAAAERNGVTRTAFILYTPDASLGSYVAAHLRRAFTRIDIQVLALLRADGQRWFDLDRRAVQGRGRRYDVADHPFAAQSVYEGAVTHTSRAELAASVAAVPDRVQRVVDALPVALGRLGESQAAAEALWVEETITATAREPAPVPLDDATAARLLVAITDTGLRDVAWSQIRRATASRHVALWTDVLRRTPEEFLAAPGCLLAFAAWQSGQGALAWCALDRCHEAEPENSLALAIAAALERAVPPGAWDDRGSTGTGSGP
jgi:hypothetical protein